MTKNIGGKLDYSRLGPPLDVSRSLQVLRREQLSRRPKCELCSRRTSTKQASVIAHILPVEQGGHPSDPENLWSLCLSCYERLMKTRAEAKLRRAASAADRTGVKASKPKAGKGARLVS